MTLDNFEWLLIIVIGSILIGLVKYLFGVVVDNHKTILTEIKGSVSSLKECLDNNEMSFEEFRMINETRELTLQKEIQELGGKIEHMNNNVKGYGEQIHRLNVAFMVIEEKQKEHSSDIKEIWGMLHELKAKVA